MLHWLLAHWFEAGGVGVLGLAIAFPGISLPALRFLLLTERGRYLLLAGIVVCSFRLWGDHRFAQGHSAAVAEQARKTAKQSVDSAFAALDEYRADAERLRAIDDRYQREKTDGAQAAYDRALSDVRSGRVRLREAWRDVPATATASERDAASQRRDEAAASLVRIGAESDAQLRACQAVIEADRK